MKYSEVKYKTFDSVRNFGIELEIDHLVPKIKVSNLIKAVSDRKTNVSKYQASNDNDFWHIKDDATCGGLGRSGPKGVEVASYVASGVKDIEHIASVARFLSLSGCNVNNNCGFHIHADIKDFDLEKAGILLAYWLKIESFVENILPPNRRKNKYCKKLSKTKVFDKNRFWNPHELFIFFAPTNLGTYENEDRRVSFNFVNYIKSVVTSKNTRQTIELRYPEGTLDYFDIKFWTVLYLNFLENCKSRDMPKDLKEVEKIDDFLNILGLNHDENVFHIFDKNLHETRLWVLRRLMKYGDISHRKQAQKKHTLLTENLLSEK